MMDVESEQAAYHEDPTSEKMLQARLETFGSHWPHEKKRGWLCKTRKVQTNPALGGQRVRLTKIYRWLRPGGTIVQPRRATIT